MQLTIDPRASKLFFLDSGYIRAILDKIRGLSAKMCGCRRVWDTWRLAIGRGWPDGGHGAWDAGDPQDPVWPGDDPIRPKARAGVRGDTP